MEYVYKARKQFHYVYKVVHLPTGRYYVGKRSTPKITAISEDAYLGSGVAWKAVLRAYDRSEFVKQVLCQTSGKHENATKERELISESMLKDVLCFNLCKGGHGGDALNFIKKNGATKNAQIAAETLKKSPKKIAARNANISEARNRFIAANPQKVTHRIGVMNAAVRGTTKLTNPAIQKQIDSRRANHLAKMNFIMLELVRLDYLKSCTASSVLQISKSTVCRMRKLMRNGVLEWQVT